MDDAQIASLRALVAQAFEDQTDEDTLLRGTVEPELVNAAVALVAEIRDMGAVFEEAAILELDELVHESMEEAEGEPEENSQTASDINNRGLEGQVACILIGWGADEGAQRIRSAAGLSASSPAP